MPLLAEGHPMPSKTAHKTRALSLNASAAVHVGCDTLSYVLHTVRTGVTYDFATTRDMDTRRSYHHIPRQKVVLTKATGIHTGKLGVLTQLEQA